MKRSFVLAVILAFGGLLTFAQCTSSSGKSPQEVVEQVWKLAAEGELMTPEGWDKTARGFFADYPFPPPNSEVSSISKHWTKSILVMSNGWGVVDCKIEGNKARVAVEYYDAGRIDPLLRYTPGKEPEPMGKTTMGFTLVFAPVHYASFKSEGNALRVEKIVTGPAGWQIEHAPVLPWATLNTAIRYVLETREKTHDPVIKKNADQTLAVLLKLHF